MAKILIVGHPNSPFQQQRGLAGQRAGHEILWFSAPRAMLPGVRSFGVPKSTENVAMLRLLLKPIFLAQVIRRIKPDIIHVHYAQTGLMVFPLLKFHPLVVTVMGGDILPDQEYRGIAAMPIRWLLRHADCITSKSVFMDDALNKIGDFGTKIRRITWGIDFAHFHPNRDVSALRRRWSIPEDDFVFFDPRLAKPFYNKHIILQAFAKYLNSGGASALLLVAESFADRGYVNRLHQQAKDLGISKRVRFVGAIPYGEMPDYYTLADATISIPPSDGLPQTIHEAFACGSFLIMSDLPQYRGIVENGVTAHLAPVGDEGALTEALFWAVAHPKVRQEAKSLGRAFVERHADFNAEAVKVNQMYEALLTGRN